MLLSKLRLMKNIPLGIILLLLLGNLSFINAQALVINEFLASNESINRDPDFHVRSDWIEIYNPSETSIDLEGFYLTDNLQDSTRWYIPDGAVIESEGFLLFWADGKDDHQNSFHTNFKLSKSGEEIGLYSSEGVLIDFVIYESQMCDVSFGRQPDGSAEWFFYNDPTPNASNNTDVFLKTSSPKFSLVGGFYTENQILELSVASPSAVIRYTLNGNEPTASSPIYTSPLQITSRAGDPNVFSEIRTNRDPFPWLPDWVPPAGEIFKATVVRARAFREGYQPSDIITQTYFVDENMHQRYATLPVISVVSDYKHLFNNATGIYVPGNTHRARDSGSGNYFQNWEKPAHIEFFEPGGNLGFSQDVGIRIQGGSSPASPQKGLHVIARSEYGLNRIWYPIFKDSKSRAKDLTEFKRFIIRAWGSSILAAMFNDALGHRLMEESDLDIQAYRPAIVFINGEYWGLHELREANKNSWYYQFHYGLDRVDPGCDILLHSFSNGRPRAFVDEGNASHWNAMVNFINSHDMSLTENYEYIKTQMDVDNFIMYLGHCIYAGKWDWPNNNDASWRPKTPDGKWRWIQFDMETSFGIATGLGPEFEFLGPQYNMFKHTIEGTPIPDFGQFGPHPILAQLLENTEFRNSFIKWFKDHLDKEFLPETMNAKLDEMVAELEPYLTEYRNRWPFVSEITSNWHFEVEKIRDFVNIRPAHVRQHLIEQFGTDTVSNDPILPEHYRVFQNYPNPFKSTTAINYQLTAPSKITVKVYDITGREITAITKNHHAGGVFSVSWDASDQANGIYYYVINAGDFRATKKMILLK